MTISPLSVSRRHMVDGVALRLINSLLAHLRSTLISHRQFRDGLKSHLFADAYFWSSENIRYKSVLYLLTYLLMSQLRRGGTHYHPTLDLAVLWTPSNDTSRPICSDSLNLMPPAPWYLWTLWRYTNAVIIIIIIIICAWWASVPATE